ncbi:MAG: hypothetical protein CL555_01560 [Algoriphagus sp.]|nr:hypothetical protein [Algoriphagus sp.]
MVEDSTLDQTLSPAFKAWFRDSKVVDENGKPLVVYHATQSDFDSFDKKKAGSAIDFGTLGEGFYFTSDPENASNYARNLSSNTGISGGENIIPAFLSIKNPYKAKNLREVSGDNKSESRKFREKLIAKGYDGIEFDNPFGPFSWYVAFEPTQIKSATGNNGDFNPDNADIRFMKVGASNADFSAVNSKNLQDAKLSWWERKVIEPLQDRMIRGKKLIKAKAGDQVSDKADFYTRENLKSGKTLEKARRFEKDLWNPMIQTANQIKNATGLEPSDISDYLKFKHHGERKQYFIDEYKKEGKAIPKDEKWPTGMTDQEAADGIKAFESKVDKRLVDKLNKQVKAVSRFTTVERFKAGMITKEVYRDLLTRYKNYVPLTDWKGMEATNDQVYTLLMSAKGRTSEAADPLPFLFTAAQEAIMRGENNRVRQSVLEFVKENVSPGDYFIRKAYYVNTRSQDEFGNDIWIETMNKPTDAQLANGEAMSSFNPQVHRHVQQQGETTNVLPVMVEGKKVFIEFKDPEIPSTIKNINQDKVPGYLTWMRKYTRWLSSMYTQYSPEFGVRNLIRDVGFGVYNMMVDQDATTARKTIGKMAKSTGTLGYFFRTGEYRKGKDGNYLKEFMEEGAMTGYTDLETAADVFRRAQKEISKADQTNLWQKGGKALAKPILAFGEGIEIYNKTLENAMRFSYYKTLRDQGMSKQKAAIRAKDLTVNFNRKGKSSSALGAVYIFFNAAVQGNERLIRSFTNPKTRRKASGYAGAVIAAGMMQSLLFGLFDEEDEDGKTFYEKIPDYVRRNNLILRNPFSENPNDFVKIPLPYGLNIFHSFGESLGQVLTGRKSVGQEAIGMLSAASNVFSPLGGFEFSSEQDGFEQVAQVAFPSAGQPLLDLAFNRNFTGRAIYREPSQYANYSPPDSQMYFEGVNPYIKEATTFLNQLTGGNEVKSGAIDINPEWIEYGMEQYFGGPVQFGKNMSTTITELINGENVLEDPNIRPVPFVRSFVSKTGTDFEARQNFYENRNNAEAAMEEYKAYLKKGMDQEAAEFFQENQNLMMLADIHKKYDKHISEMTRTINQLKKADPEQYDDQIEQLYEQRTQLMREFNKQYGEIMFKNRPNPIKQILNLD